jgi:hypothetical protein
MSASRVMSKPEDHNRGTRWTGGFELDLSREIEAGVNQLREALREVVAQSRPKTTRVFFKREGEFSWNVCFGAELVRLEDGGSLHMLVEERYPEAICRTLNRFMAERNHTAFNKFQDKICFRVPDPSFLKNCVYEVEDGQVHQHDVSSRMEGRGQKLKGLCEASATVTIEDYNQDRMVLTGWTFNFVPRVFCIDPEPHVVRVHSHSEPSDSFYNAAKIRAARILDEE